MTPYHQYISQISYNSLIPSNIQSVLPFPKLCYKCSLFEFFFESWFRKLCTLHLVNMLLSPLIYTCCLHLSLFFPLWSFVCFVEEGEGEEGGERKEAGSLVLQFPAVYIFVVFYMCFLALFPRLEIQVWWWCDVSMKTTQEVVLVPFTRGAKYFSFCDISNLPEIIKSDILLYCSLFICQPEHSH